MLKFLENTFRVKPEEAPVVLAMGLILLVNALALNVSEVVAISGFLNTVDLPQILWVWIFNMVFIIIVTALSSLLVDKIGRKRLLNSLALIIMVAYLVLRSFFIWEIIPPQFNYSFLYLLSEQQGVFFPLIFWVLANDIFQLHQAKRLFPFIASFAFVGQILGLILGALAPSIVDLLGIPVTELLTFNVVLFLIAYLILLNAMQQVNIKKASHKVEPIRETLSEGWGFVKAVKSFRFLTISMIMVFIVVTVLEYNWLAITSSAEQLEDAGTFQTFYSLYYLVLTLMGWGLQSLLTSRIIERISLKNVFIILPIVLLTCAVLTLVFPAMLIVATLAFALPYLSMDAIDAPANKAFQSLVPEARRGRVSLFMDSYLYGFGTILGCVIVGLVAWLTPEGYVAIVYLTIGVICSLISVVSIFRMRKDYDTSLLNWRLKRRSRGKSVLDKLEF